VGQHGRSRARAQRGRCRVGVPVAARLIGVVLGCTVLSAALAHGAPPDPKAEAKTKRLNPTEVVQAVEVVAEAQRALAATLGQVREQLNETQRTLGELRDELRQNRDVEQTVLEQTKGMREEVRGLYVESSGLKGDIAQAGKQVEGLDQSLGSFRLSAGIVVAVIIVLQFVLIGLMFRGRG